MSIPTKQSLLVPYVVNFSDRITATPGAFDCDAGDATALSAVVDPYVAAATPLLVPENRSRPGTAARRAAQAAMMPVLRALYLRVQSSLAVTDANKVLLGVTMKSAPSPVPVPGTWPGMDILSTVGRKVKVRLHDDSGDGKRAKPPGVVGAVVASYYGPNPQDPSLYKWEGSTNRSIFEVEFPASVAPGTVVYLSAMWLNAKNQNGPACPPVATTIQFVQGMGSNAQLKIAA